MTLEDKIVFIQAVATTVAATGGGEILWSLHAAARLISAGLARLPVEAALQSCEPVEDYPTISRPLPDCLVLGYPQAQPLHAVVALEPRLNRILMVTVYRPSRQRWQDDWKTRK